MTNSLSNPVPNYSGVTIQITNPTVNAGPGLPPAYYCPNCQPIVNGEYVTNPAQNTQNVGFVPNNGSGSLNNVQQIVPQNQPAGQNNVTNPATVEDLSDRKFFQSYPPQYYMNNYNIQGNPETVSKVLAEAQKNQPAQNNIANNIPLQDSAAIPAGAEVAYLNGDQAVQQSAAAEQKPKTYQELLEDAKKYEKPVSPNDMTKSTEIKDDLDARALAIENEKKNSTQKNVVALTDEYIKSLENYLNNPNDEIRLMASKDILTRLDEDKDRYNDAALNALLNKMLQDPSKLIRVAALSAFASQLASGNDYTVQLLNNIQQNPNADKEDVIQAADILLKMSGGREVKNIPNPAVKDEGGQQAK